MPVKTPAISFDAFSTFGDLLKYLRRRAGLTQRELSIAVGYSDAQISRLEQNQRLPDLATITARFVPALDADDEPAVVKRLMELAAAVRREDAPLPGLPPFKGLHYFDEADAELFFGREALTAKLLARFVSPPSSPHAPRFLAVIGASGSGKSSLVRAGVAPALRWNPHTASWPVYTLTPTAQPLEALAAALGCDRSFADDLARDPRSLHLTLKQAAQKANALHAVLVVDQFEETFTLCREEAERLAFINNTLTAAFMPEGPAIVTLTLRADFYAHCAPYDNLREALAQHQEYIGPMTAGELRRAIEEPAKQGGWELEPGLVDLLLQDVGEEPGALPLLSHALLETWQRRQGRRLTLSGYTSSGGVRGAIAETAETVFKDQLSAEQRDIARRIFLRLTELGEDATVSDTRRRAGYDELIHKPEDAPAVREVLKALADARLIITEKNSAEVAHEALIREWPTLRGWLEENREGLLLQRRLTEAAQTWNEFGRQPGELYRDARLAQAVEWAATHAAEMNALEREYLDASKEHAEHEAAEREAQRQRELEAARRLAETERARAESEQQRAEEQVQYVARVRTRNRVIAAAGAMALVLAVLAGLFGLQSNQNATRAETNLGAAQIANTQSAANAAAAQAASTQAFENAATAQAEAVIRATAEAIALQKEEEAQQQALIASVRELAGAANLNLDIDPERSILLALQAVALTDKTGQPPLLEAQDALHRAVQTSRVQLTLRGHTAEIHGLAYSPDGTRLATFADDGSIKIWEAATGAELLSLPTEEMATNVNRFLSFSPDGKHLAASAAPHLAKVWDVASGKELLALAGHTDEVTAVIFSPDGKLIATSSGDQTAKIWDAATGQELLTLTGQNEAVNDVAFSPDGAYLATAGEDSAATIWDAVSGQVLFTLPSSAGVTSVAFSPDGKTIATGGYDTTWKLWDVSTGQKLLTGFGHASNLGDISFDQTGTRVATANEDGRAKIWEVATGRELLTLSGHASGVLGAAFSPDGVHVATASRDTTAKIWDVSPAGGSEWLNLVGHTDRVFGVAYSLDGKWIATGSYDGSAKLWDATTGKEIYTLGGGHHAVLGVTFTPDSARLITAGVIDFNNQGDLSTVTIWDVMTGKELLTITDRFDGAVALSPDGKTFATNLEDKTIKIWDTATGKLTLTLVGTSFVQQLAYSPDGKRLSIAPEDGIVKIWDTTTGQVLMTLTYPTGSLTGITFSPDGKLIATTGNDSAVKIWDAETGKLLNTLTGHTGPTFGVAFSPDGRYLASTSVDGTVKIWSVADDFTSQPLTLYGHTRAIYRVAFSPDGTRIVTASRDGTARVYAFSIDDLVSIAKSRLTRTLTEQECQQYLHGPCP